jgi:hypothetical protein
MNRRFVSVLLAIVLVASAVVPVGALAAVGETKRADLQVYQPHYIDSSVKEKKTDNVTVYETKGRVLELRPRNFNSSDVVSVSIAEDVGSIRHDAARDVYVLDSEKTEATLRITWVVREQVEKTVVEDNVTKTVNRSVRNQYVAVVKTSKTDLAHVPSSKVDQLQQDAENWSEVASLYGGVGSPNKPIEKKLQFGAKLVATAHNPIKALSGDFGMAIQAVFFTAGGLIFFVLWNIPHLVRSRRLRRENKELKEKIGDYEDVDDALDELFTEKRKRFLKEKTWNDWFDDLTAAWLRRNFAPEPHAGIKRIESMLSPVHVYSIVAGAMLDSGRHSAVVEYDPDSSFRADGGDVFVDLEQEVVSARMVDRDQVDRDELEPHVRVIESSDDLTESIVAQFPTGSLDSDVILREDVDLRSTALPIANTPREDDLIEELNVSIPDDFESREHFAEVLNTIIVKVAATDYATPDGSIDPSRDLANLLMGFSSIFGESYSRTYLRFVRDVMMHNIDRLDASKRTVDVVEEARDRHEQGSRP